MRIILLAWLAAATGVLGGCTATDMASMDETFNNTPEKQAAMSAQMEQNRQASENETVTDRYLYYHNAGYPDQEAVRQAYKDTGAGVPPVR